MCYHDIYVYDNKHLLYIIVFASDCEKSTCDSTYGFLITTSVFGGYQMQVFTLFFTLTISKVVARASYMQNILVKLCQTSVFYSTCIIQHWNAPTLDVLNF